MKVLTGEGCNKLDPMGLKVIGDYLKTCRNRAADKMVACKKEGKDVDPRDDGRVDGFCEAYNMIQRYRSNVDEAIKVMTAQAKRWEANTHPAPYHHSKMLASAEAMQEAIDLLNIYHIEYICSIAEEQ